MSRLVVVSNASGRPRAPGPGRRACHRLTRGARKPRRAPIRYLNKGFGRLTTLGFLSISSVALVTPLRDGMNLVAKEFVAAQDPEDPGVLVLSHLAGAARELSTTVIINPYDIDDQANGLSRDISMPREERKERWEAMMDVLRGHDIHAWRREYVEALDQAAESAAPPPNGASTDDGASLCSCSSPGPSRAIA